MTIARRFSKPASAAVLGALALTVALTAALPSRDASAADWREKYPNLTLGVITAENEADRVTRYKAVIDYFRKTLNVGIKWRTATDYAGIIEGVKAGKIEIARFGPASYAKAWIVTNGKVVPMVGEISNDGTFGYFSVALVKKDSPYKTIQDLKGKRFAFAGIMAIAVSDTGTLAKLFAEAIEGVERKQVDGVRAAGAGNTLVMRLGMLPQVLPVILSNILYFFESNTRSATILGVVGAGGIGLHLSDRIRANNWDEAAFIILMILVTVSVIDYASRRLRESFIGAVEYRP